MRHVPRASGNERSQAGVTPPSPDDDGVRPLLVTVAQAAQVLAVGRTTIYELISTGQLTPIHIGRSVRLPVRQLEDFVNAQLSSSTDAEAASIVPRSVAPEGPREGPRRTSSSGEDTAQAS
jgi:excisionase family DNA binding protein